MHNPPGRIPGPGRTAPGRAARGLPAPEHRHPGPSPAELDDRIRLFQGVLEARLLRNIDGEVAGRVRPAADRAWFERIAVLTGLPTAFGDATPLPHHVPLAPLVLEPRPRRLEELREAHVELRRRLLDTVDPATASHIRAALAITSEMARALREAGLRRAYVAAARRSKRTEAGAGGNGAGSPA